MKIPYQLLASLVLLPALLAAETNPARFQGDYTGERRLLDGTVEPMVAHVIHNGRDRYMVRFADTNEGHSQTLGVLDVGQIRDGQLVFPRDIAIGAKAVRQVVDGGLIIDATQWSGVVVGKTFTGEFSGKENGTFKLTYEGTERYKSPSLGKRPPKDAVVLFDGSDLDDWTWGELSHVPIWVVQNGEFGINLGGPSIKTKDSFGDFFLHLEFKSPLMGWLRGQKRGNSGVYLHDRYEVQILDSYGLAGEWNECGGVYQVARPLTNMCAPANNWQSYEIDFRAPRFDEDGNKTENARMTVRHNGVLIHEDLEVPRVTGGAVSQTETTAGPIRLQNHGGDRVRFRNVWLVEK